MCEVCRVMRLSAESFEKISPAEKRRRMKLYNQIWSEVEKEIEKLADLIRQETLAELRELEKYFAKLRRGNTLAAESIEPIPKLTAAVGPEYIDDLKVTITNIQNSRAGQFEIRVDAVLQSSGQTFSSTAATNLGERAGRYSAETEQWISNHVPEIVDDIGKKTKKQIFRQVAEGARRGETIDQIEGRIRSQYNHFARSSSATIARTETGFVHAQAGWNTVKNLAIPNNELIKTWLTARDGRVRGFKLSDHANHVVLDGQRRMFMQTFSNGLLYPRQPGGKISETANCRCISLYERINKTKPVSPVSFGKPISVIPFGLLMDNEPASAITLPEELTSALPAIVRNDVKDGIKSLRDVGKTVKKSTDALLKSIAESQGGELHGLSNSLKTQSAIAGKLARLMQEEDMTLPQAMDNIHDINRYTLVFPESVFDEKMAGAVSDIQADGWKLASSNNIDSDLYHGVNTNFTQNGNYLEVQFHTPESVAVNNSIHSAYMETQSLSAGESQIAIAEDKIISAWS